MRRIVIRVKKFSILCHRWMGVAFCVLFAWWFVSGIFMMYWDYPAVGAEERLLHAPPIDANRIKLTPAEAFAALGGERDPAGVQLAMLDGRPVYRFGAAGGGGRRGRQAPAQIVYADDGSVQGEYTPDQLLRMASAWAGQPGTAAVATHVDEPDQWTLGVRNQLPLVKYSFPDGQQVYYNERTGQAVQYTTPSLRLFAHLSAIPHWLYYTPLRVQQKLWTNVVIWSSGLGTIMALLGMIVGVWMYSPNKKYRLRGQPTRVPYTGQKRLHMILGLFFGIVTCTWAFSGMLSMEPFPIERDRSEPAESVQRVQAAFRPDRFSLAAYASKSLSQAIQEAGAPVKELELSSLHGVAYYAASLGAGKHKIIPVDGPPRDGFDPETLVAMARGAAAPGDLAEVQILNRYDAYYIARNGSRTLPVVRVTLHDPQHTQLYVEAKTARIALQHSDTSSFVTRWLYHGLHSLDFPWLYNYRPLWDGVVLLLMMGGFSLCVTSVIIGWRLLRR